MKRTLVTIDESTITFDLCKQALLDASLGKRNRGYIKPYLEKVDEYAKEVQSILINHEFTPSPYKYASRIEHGKLRDLTMPVFFPDQVVHHILIELMNKDYRLLMLTDPNSMSGIPGRGRFLAIKSMVDSIRNLKENAIHCIHGDIRKCYPSISNTVAYNAVARYYKGDYFLKIIHDILSMHDSLPLGIYMSSFLINLILRPLDQMIRRDQYVWKNNNIDYPLNTATYYSRYMDDFVILGGDKTAILNLREKIREELAKIGLQLKYISYTDLTKQSIDFVGIKISITLEPIANGMLCKAYTHTSLRKNVLKKIKRKLKRYAGYNCKKRYYTNHELLGLISMISVFCYIDSDTLVNNYLLEYGISMYKLKEAAYEKRLKDRSRVPNKFVNDILQNYNRIDYKDNVSLYQLYNQLYPDSTLDEFEKKQLIDDCKNFFLEYVLYTPMNKFEKAKIQRAYRKYQNYIKRRNLYGAV